MALDTDKFAKVMARAASGYDGERLNSMRLAETQLVKDLGLTFADIANQLREAGSARSAAQSTAQPAQSARAATVNPFAGFDDWMEKEEPDWKAKQAAERAERLRKRKAELAEIIARYGSKEAALAPCPREQLLIDATRHLARKEWKQYVNGRAQMDTLDGWDGFKDSPQSVIDAVSAAYPLPRTVTEAKAECDYWQNRNHELELVYGNNIGDTMVGLAAQAREEIVRKLFRYGLPAETVAEVEMRVAAQVEGDSYDEKMVKVAQADLRRLSERQGQDAAQHPTVTERRSTVIALLQDPANMGRSDRDIAATIGVSPQTVGNLRRKLGIAVTPRTVTRRGRNGQVQKYQMK
jgi:hypothetical protein